MHTFTPPSWSFFFFFSDSTGTEIKITASLVFREVSAEDLSKHYTCKLESERPPSTSITVTLEQKGAPFTAGADFNLSTWGLHEMKWVILGKVLLWSTSGTGFLIACNWSPVASLNFLVEALWIGIGIVIVVTMMAAVLYIKLKKSRVFSLQDVRTCHGSTSGKTSHLGLSSAPHSFCETPVRCRNGHNFHRCFLFLHRWEEIRCLVGVLQEWRRHGNDGTWQEMDEEYFGGKIWLCCLWLRHYEGER